MHFFISMASYRAVKRPEPSPETLRASTQLRDRKPEEPPPRLSEDAPRDGGDYRPQYLDLPPRQGGGVRNVLLGVLLIFAAALVLSYATYLTGPRAILPLGVALLTAVTLFALARLRVFKQRNGSFLAVGLICLLGVLVPLVEYALSRGGAVRAEVNDGSTPASQAPAGGRKASSGPQLLTEAFNLQPPASDAFAFRVRQDLQVDMNGKKYVIKEGDQFAVSDVTGEDVLFAAGGEQIALPLGMVEMLGSPDSSASATPPPETGLPGNEATPASANPANVAATSEKKGPVNITEEAQREAIRRFPAIGVRNSRENQLFIDSYQELKMSGADDFFANPQWPLALADMLAKRHGWTQPGQAPAEARTTSDGSDEVSGLPEAPRPKRRPVAEELDDEPEPEAGAEAPAAASEAAEPMDAPAAEPDAGADLPE